MGECNTHTHIHWNGVNGERVPYPGSVAERDLAELSQGLGDGSLKGKRGSVWVTLSDLIPVIIPKCITGKEQNENLFAGKWVLLFTRIKPLPGVVSWLGCSVRKDPTAPFSLGRLDEPQCLPPGTTSLDFPATICRGQIRSLYLRRPLVRKPRVLPLPTQPPGPFRPLTLLVLL